MKRTALVLGSVAVGAGIFFVVRNARQSKHGNGRRNSTIRSSESNDVIAEGLTWNEEQRKASTDQKIGSSHAGLEIDDRGTTQAEALEILEKIRDNGFGSSDEKLALALGRSADEITSWRTGGEPVDADALIKARALAQQRGISID